LILVGGMIVFDKGYRTQPLDLQLYIA